MFEKRVAKYWNKLPQYVKCSENVINFKVNLESFKTEKIEEFGNYWELSDEIFNRINDQNREDYVNFMLNNPYYIAKRRNINIHS